MSKRQDWSIDYGIQDAPEIPRCGQCLYFDVFYGHQQSYGVCRRHAPVVGEMDWDRYPRVNGDWWCGEYRNAHQTLQEWKRQQEMERQDT